jgi:phospholipid/cholesterol/gamma-HCH transport system substrate-binding protein
VVFNKVQGLKPGTGVTISGVEIGNVKMLRLNPQSKVELTLEVLETYKDYIRQDSQATIASGLLGGKTVEITVGSSTQPPLPEGGKIPSREPKELTDILKEIDVQAPLKKFDEALENVKSITEKLNSPQGELFTLLRNVEFVTAQLKNGQGNIGAILQDKKMHAEITSAVESIRRSAANMEETTQNASRVSRDLPQMVAEVDRAIKEVPRILDDVKKATADLPKGMGDVQKAMTDAPKITENVKDITQDVKVITGNVKKAAPQIPDFLTTTQETVEEAEKLIKGLQDHWLLRGSMPKTRNDTPVEISQRESPYEKRGGASR